MGDVRIIAGEHKGRRLKVPASVARPTTDRVREALMSIIASARGGFEGARVLDAFAGSGALALEALSRGAECAVLVERDAKAAKVVESNARALGYDQEHACVLRADTFKTEALIPRLRRFVPFDLVMLDPPYKMPPEEVVALIEALVAAHILDRGAFIMYEHAADVSKDIVSSCLEQLQKFLIVKQRDFGTTSVALIKVI